MYAPLFQVEELALSGDILNAVGVQACFSLEAFVRAATTFFSCKSLRPLTGKVVITGHKNHGKSQCIYFLLKLLHAIGEAAILLDASLESDLIKSVKEGEGKANYLNPQFCAKDWSSYMETRDDVFTDTSIVKNYVEGGSEEADLATILQQMEEFAADPSKGRAWLLVDEVTHTNFGS